MKNIDYVKAFVNDIGGVNSSMYWRGNCNC